MLSVRRRSSSDGLEEVPKAGFEWLASEAADWSSLEKTKIEVFTHHLGHNVDVVADALNAFDVIVAMRERTPFPASLIEKLPNLRLLVTTGMRNLSIDMEAARVEDIDVCGTDMLSYPAFEHTWALILAITKKIPLEAAFFFMRAGVRSFRGPRRGSCQSSRFFWASYDAAKTLVT